MKSGSDASGLTRFIGGTDQVQAAPIVARLNGATSYTFSGLDGDRDELYRTFGGFTTNFQDRILEISPVRVG